MIGYYNYTVILTYIGTLFGFTGIMYTWNGNVRAALICLMLAGFCDMFDGKVASLRERTKQEKRFGIQIDSLSDLICFGVLPALIIINYSGSFALNSVPAIICKILGALYVLCALIRLAWFNVDEEERQSQETGSRENYLGLPVTTAALIFPIAIGIGGLVNSYLVKFPLEKVSPYFLLVVAAAFLTPFHLKKPKLVGKLIMIAVGVVGCATVIFGIGEGI